MRKFFPRFTSQLAVVVIAILYAFGDSQAFRLLDACEQLSITYQKRTNIGASRCRQEIFVGKRREEADTDRYCDVFLH